MDLSVFVFETIIIIFTPTITILTGATIIDNIITSLSITLFSLQQPVWQTLNVTVPTSSLMMHVEDM